MAKIKLGNIIADIRGANQGSVFSKGRGGNVVRQWVTPTFVKTSSRIFTEARFINAAKQWRSLTATQRAAWNSAVPQWLGTDVFGNVLTPSGFNLFIKLNYYRQISIGATQSDPPAPTAIPQIYGVTFTANKTGSSFVVNYSFLGSNTGISHYLYVSKPVSAGVFSTPSKYQLLLAGNLTGSTVNFYSAYQSGFGTPGNGTKIFCQILSEVIATGQFSSRRVVSALVV